MTGSVHELLVPGIGCFIFVDQVRIEHHLVFGFIRMFIASHGELSPRDVNHILAGAGHVRRR